MAEPPVEPAENSPRKKRSLLLAAIAVLLGGGGFASTYLGIWSPISLLDAPAAAEVSAEMPAVMFVDVPRVQLTIPSPRPQVLYMTAKIETDAVGRGQIEHLMPRVQDAFNTFLSDIDPSAFDKRGVLEIIRAELINRTRFVLGDEPVKDLLITEFLVQ